APLTVSGLSGTPRNYNGSVIDALSGTGTLAGLVSGETLTLGGATGTLGSANAGSETLTTALTLISGSGLAANYVLTQPALANVTIAPAPLTVSGLSGTPRNYNGSVIDALSGTGTLAGLVSGETLTLGGATGTLGSANAGSETLTTALTLISGSGVAANYVLTQRALANVTIAPAPLTVSGLSGTPRNYNGSVIDALSGTGTLAGLVSGETLTLGGATGTLGSANAGSETLTTALTLISGSGLAANYVLTQPALASVTIAPAPLTVAGQSAGDKVYDGTRSALLTGGSLSGVIAGDAPTLTLTQAGSFVSKNVGSIGVTASDTLSGTSAANSTLTEPVGLMANIMP